MTNHDGGKSDEILHPMGYGEANRQYAIIYNPAK